MDSPLVAVRPPEYWPRLLFMALVDAADLVVLGDTLQYSRQSHQNRTLVRTPQDSQWLSIPLKGRQHGMPICDVVIRGKHRWIRKHWRALHYNYRTTPFFDFFEADLAPIFNREWRRLGELTCTSVRVLAGLFEIDTPVVRASELENAPSSIGEVLSVAGASGLLSAADAVDADRSLTDVDFVLRLEPLEYRQNFEGFAPGMSALDLLFNYGPEALSMLRRAAIVRPDPIPRN